MKGAADQATLSKWEACRGIATRYSQHVFQHTKPPYITINLQTEVIYRNMAKFDATDYAMHAPMAFLGTWHCRP